MSADNELFKLIGGLQASVESMEKILSKLDQETREQFMAQRKEIAGQAKQIASLESVFSEVKGGWKVLAFIAAVVSAVVSSGATYLKIKIAG